MEAKTQLPFLLTLGVQTMWGNIKKLCATTVDMIKHGIGYVPDVEGLSIDIVIITHHS